MSDKVNKSIAKNPRWETARILGIKKGAFRRHQEKQDALAAEIRTLQNTLKALDEAEGQS